jgi:hypothetical protein
MLKCSFYAVVLVASVLTSFTLGQQTPDKTTSAAGNGALQQPVLKVKTRLVIVDVVARNSKGEPITDLKADDFTVIEDDKPQHISTFNFQQPDSKARASQAPVLPPDTFNNLPRYKPNGALNVLLLDALNTSMPNQAYAREAMIKLLEKLPQGQPMAVYLLGNRRGWCRISQAIPNCSRKRLSVSKISLRIF